MVFEEALRNIAFGLVRIGSFMASATLFGLPVVLLLVLRPGWVPAEDPGDRARLRLAARIDGLVQAALWAAVVTAALIVVLQGLVVAEIQGGGFGLDSVLDAVDSSFGRWHLIRLPLLVALALMLSGRVGAAATGGLGSGDSRAPNGLWWGLWVGLALFALSTSTFSGHASVSSPLALALVNDVVHLAAGAVWFSGIVVLASVLPAVTRGLEGAERLRLAAPIVARFSAVALVAIGVVALTGTFNSLFNLERPGDLVDSGYGQLLAAKIAAFLGVLALGGVNHFYVRRRLETAARSSSGTPAQALFRKTIAVELALGLLLMGLTGFLVGSARTRPSAAPPAVSSSAR